jgi:hypothetical protein
MTQEINNKIQKNKPNGNRSNSSIDKNNLDQHIEEITYATSQSTQGSRTANNIILSKQHAFWYAERDKDGNAKNWKINHKKLIDFIRLLGFRRYDHNKDYIFIQIIDKVIDEVGVNFIQDVVLNSIESILDTEWLRVHEIEKSTLLAKLFISNTSLFNKNKLSLLGTQHNLHFNKDTKDTIYTYYRNGFVKCTASGVELLKYSELKNYIFKSQQHVRDFIPGPHDGSFFQFNRNASKKDGSYNDKRLGALMTLQGYLMHSNFDQKLSAVNFTDSLISDHAEGRTGKSLMGIGLSKIKRTCDVPGKDFDPTSNHKYSRADMATQLVFHNDAKKNLKLESLYNDITDGITVDGKYEKPFLIKAKYLITSNAPLRTEGDSSKDRVFEFEFSNHYSLNHRPEDDFGHWFFTDWDSDEWAKFDNFMMECSCKYLKEGVIISEEINLSQRKQIESTSQDFVFWLQTDVELRPGIEYNKRELYNKFLEAYPEYKDQRFLKNQAGFTRWLKSYANYSDNLKGRIFERRSDGNDYITFGLEANNNSPSLF